MKNRICIVLCLCSALLACNRENTETTGGRDRRSDDPVELLRAFPGAAGFDRAFILERLYLTKEAIAAWNEVAAHDSERAKEARAHLERLQRLPDPLRQWSTDEVDQALERRDEAALTKMVRAFPVDAARYFDRVYVYHHEHAAFFAKVLAESGQPFPKAVVDAGEQTKDRAALEQGLDAMRRKDVVRAAPLFERAGNPFALAAYSYRASPPELDKAIRSLKPQYRELSWRLHTYRAHLLESEGGYLAAHAEYGKALDAAKGEPTLVAAVRGRESFNFAIIGDAEAAFRDAHSALSLLTRVADVDTRNHAYSGAANAAALLGHPDVALLYQNAAVAGIQRAVIASPTTKGPKIELSVALRKRAEIEVQLGRDAEAKGDLEQAADFAEAAEYHSDADLLRMRMLEVQGEMLLHRDPAQAASRFSEAIELAKNQNPTYRAILRFKRAEAWRKAGDAHADGETAAAASILREEVRNALANAPEAASEPLWDPYFLRFRDRQDRLIADRIENRDVEGALVYDELARAFEPMQILLQSRSLPPGFRFIETPRDLQSARATLPEDTVILQYLVLQNTTYTWVITRERINGISQSVGKADIEGWVAEVRAAAGPYSQGDPITRVARAAYAELFRAPLKLVSATKTRIVIVPDGAMQGLPFNALGEAKDKYLIDRASIATAGSMSLYLYALARDRQLSKNRQPTALLVANPEFKGFERLRYAVDEVQELSRDFYPGAETLIGAEATVERFLSGAKKATIIHFAGHARTAPEPWQSRLLLAWELTAQKLMQQLPKLERTRLVVLSACSSGGGSVGPQGLAPIVRPFIAANVPAVVGSLWNVPDASTKELLVFFHCHYRHGDDVADALRKAQLAMLRKNKKLSVRAWAAFQVAGYAASPYPRSSALEESNSEHVCTQNSLHGPDGLHSQ